MDRIILELSPDEANLLRLILLEFEEPGIIALEDNPSDHMAAQIASNVISFNIRSILNQLPEQIPTPKRVSPEKISENQKEENEPTDKP